MSESADDRTLSSFFDIYENEAKNAEIIELAQNFEASGNRAERAELYGRIMAMLPYSEQ